MDIRNTITHISSDCERAQGDRLIVLAPRGEAPTCPLCASEWHARRARRYAIAATCCAIVAVALAVAKALIGGAS